MKKLITITFLIHCILFAITPNIPTTSWLIEINDFLPKKSKKIYHKSMRL